MGVVSLRQSSVVVVHVVVVARDYIVRRPQRIDMRRGAWLHHRQVCHLYAIDHSYILSLLSHPGRGGIGQSDRSALAFGEEHSLITATSVSSIPLRSRWHWSVRPQRIGFRRGAQLDHSSIIASLSFVPRPGSGGAWSMWSRRDSPPLYRRIHIRCGSRQQPDHTAQSIRGYRIRSTA
jgi:hypothetical protein